MPTIVTCSACSCQLRVTDELQGREVKCPSCGTTFTAALPSPANAPTCDAPPATNSAAVRPTPPSGVSKLDRGSPQSCPHCGEEVEGSASRCLQCGADLQPQEPDEDERPWEHRGRVRRDCEPHRANIVLVLGIIATVCGGMAVGLICCISPAGLLGVVGLSLGIPAWVMGRRDIKKMDEGAMDPQGRSSTHGGVVCGIIGTSLSALALLLVLISVVAWLCFMFIMPQMNTSGTTPVTPSPVAPTPAPMPARKQMWDGSPLRLLEYLPTIPRGMSVRPGI